MRRPPPQTPRLPPFRLHYPTHAGNTLSSIPPPYEMAFPPPQPKRTTSPVAVAAVAFGSAVVVLAGTLWGWDHWANARARERQRELARSERVAETQALVGAVRDRFPLGLAAERPCEDGRIPSDMHVPLLSFSQLREADPPIAAETVLQPTTFKVTRDTTLDAPVVAVLMTNEATLQPGSYDGWIVVFDRKATPLCQAHVVAKSESQTSFADFKNQLRGAERAAAARLSPKLALEL